ncbi:MAG: response regulator [Rhodospirillaceae bacterium]|nr:response regulator [Rhodospirillaceae bacterium]
MSATTILVVEDDEMVREYAQAVLETLGYETCVAADGPSALRLLDEQGNIELILTDIGLPGMSGPAFAAEARRRRPGLPVIFASGSVDSEGRAALLEPDAVVLAKPFRKAELAQLLRQTLQANGSPYSAG